MQKNNSMWGSGPKIIGSTLVYLAVILCIDTLYQPPAIIRPEKIIILYILSTLLLILGIAIWFVAGRTIVMMYKLDSLYQEGLYKFCRHPLYANFIFILSPGFSLLANSWLILTTPVFMYLSFKYFIKEEERYLIEQFGQAYIQYKQDVNSVFPKLF
jgi:protein-S-isoprenylcysteine O-methyltransferase Ste14